MGDATRRGEVPARSKMIGPNRVWREANRYRRATAALQRARRHGLEGLQFDLFGRRLGWKLLLRGVKSGWAYVLNPVSVPRDFEFEFTWAQLPTFGGSFLDVSSPRLFSLFVAKRRPDASISSVNPDPVDTAQTQRMVNALRLGAISVRGCDIRELAERDERYDCIWSISVIEHVAGEYDDRQAVDVGMLRPGGRLILTVPVDRTQWDEYRDRDYYGLQQPWIGGSYFFQRFYDLRAIEERLLAPGRPAKLLTWCGERERGRFADYVGRWLRDGIDCTLADPEEMARHYRHFPSWEAMPGFGVCGLVIEKR